MAPVLANKVPNLNRWTTPLDFGMSYKGKRILGDNKTCRGLVSGIFLGGLVAALEGTYLFRVDTKYLYIWILAGMLMGFGALMGDAVESFFKRRSGRNPGQTWFPYDQTDYIIGGLVVMLPFIGLNWGLIIRIFVLYFGLHLLLAYIGFLLGLKDKPI